MSKSDIAKHAAQNRKNWGRYATLQYVTKHGVLALYRLACQLAAMQHCRCDSVSHA